MLNHLGYRLSKLQARSAMSPEQPRKVTLMDWRLSFLQNAQLGRITFCGHNAMPKFGKASSRDQPDVSATDNSDVHSADPPCPE
jgi:hypothetical protein